MKRCLGILAAALGLAFVLPSAGYAQTDVVINGTITDSTDAVLPGVTVTALKIDNGNTFVEVTDAQGNYRLSVRPGVYKITAELAGFRPAIRENFEMVVGAKVVLNLKLALNTLSETVTVSGETPLVDTAQSKI